MTDVLFFGDQLRWVMIVDIGIFAPWASLVCLFLGVSVVSALRRTMLGHFLRLSATNQSCFSHL